MNAVVFAYHNMGVTGLEALRRHGFTIRAVFTHEDDPAEQIWFASVADWAERQGIPYFTPLSVNEPAWYERINAMTPDVIFSFIIDIY